MIMKKARVRQTLPHSVAKKSNSDLQPRIFCPSALSSAAFHLKCSFKATRSCQLNEMGSNDNAAHCLLQDSCLWVLAYMSRTPLEIAGSRGDGETLAHSSFP